MINTSIRKIIDFDQISSVKIHDLFVQSFTDSEGSQEGELIGVLVSDLMKNREKEDIQGFFAVADGVFSGGIFFTRLIFGNEIRAFMLAPVAVHSDFQGCGIGQELINFGLEWTKQSGVEVVFTYGDIKFYSKVGFSPIDESIAKAPMPLTYPQGWLAQSLKGDEIPPTPGSPECVQPFKKQAYW